jgi:hypothetical protein
MLRNLIRTSEIRHVLFRVSRKRRAQIGIRNSQNSEAKDRHKNPLLSPAELQTAKNGDREGHDQDIGQNITRRADIE